jgi:hypothetical protein
MECNAFNFSITACSVGAVIASHDYRDIEQKLRLTIHYPLTSV